MVLFKPKEYIALVILALKFNQKENYLHFKKLVNILSFLAEKLGINLMLKRICKWPMHHSNIQAFSVEECHCNNLLYLLFGFSHILIRKKNQYFDRNDHHTRLCTKVECKKHWLYRFLEKDVTDRRQTCCWQFKSRIS